MLFNQTLTYISLFSGAGVGCYGLLEEGFECVATNEILEKRLNIQRINNKCKFDESYISGDIKELEIKEKILKRIGFYSKNFGNDRVDLVVATPPCQGMSVANHKKKNDEIKRNSLVVESVDLIKQIKPRFFILENVPSFYKTGCIDKNDNLLEIGSMIEQNLSGDYRLYNEVINFKNFGANSSRTRTLVIGVCKEFKDFISALEFFPDFKEEKTLKEVIGSLKPLSWGEYDSADFYHSFRTYPKRMQEWIKDLKEGQSAFENTELNKKPHRVVGNKIILNVSKNGDKYKRQKYHSVAPCIHTRNDQMASQNTIHPKDDRVFSIRELMLLMNIPSHFKWLDLELQELNALNQQEKEKISKQNEMNIRQSIGEAVPTIIFKQIALKIKNFMSQIHLSYKEIIKFIDLHSLSEPQNLKRFILENKNKIARASLVSLAEMANSKRIEKSAYFTNPFIVNEIAKLLPSFKQESVTIIEPSVGCGNFLSALFKKYASVKKVYLKCIDIDKNSLEILEILYKDCIPNNFEMELICTDFLAYECGKVDLIVGNPPFGKTHERFKGYSLGLTHLAGIFLEKSLKLANFTAMVMPKNLLNTKEYAETRTKLEKKGVGAILDFGELGFKGVLVETIAIVTQKSKEILARSLPLNLSIKQKPSYIFDKRLPYWVIYRNAFFDKVFHSMQFGLFEVFRDRQITHSVLVKNGIRVIKSRNIDENGKIISVENYDSYIQKEVLNPFKIASFLDRDDVYLTPNMTYKPRILKKEKGYVVNGSVAILIPKNPISLSKEQCDYISSVGFRDFYKIARNYQTRTLNIDSMSCFWFGILKDS
ncbi:adenine/cytosine DNA methyltransferase [Helicobacter pylori]|uniref:adenine/cytosine DNA methyltransferase n=1 Tax=Helicobacter pylori TaxID=210 RepID=UPI0002B9D7B8|nr:adenine/cytosine DNA methyltransferase [Helicobacter pylori]EMH07396.1 C-5 cytosine-specific DNA methylase [Helicobacter pylori GAM246Ai]WRE89970.1 adenine/cytosine DNA methyltransferase [Helicobacter pylori]